MSHDFKRFPELTNSQLDLYYFSSPHRQITEDFTAKVVKVHDGDSITLQWKERDFNFPIRLINIQAPELKDELGSPSGAGKSSQRWLEELVLNEMVSIQIDPVVRVDKWGRLLGYVVMGGMDVGEQSMHTGHSIPWEMREDIAGIPKLDEVLNG